uniref:Immunoglobulin superfamily, member 10 n=1 Tax=Sinocyclocheilus grahami TaxID=75366 RepID=A0A672NCH7_SINGR
EAAAFCIYSRDQYGWAMIRKDSQTKTEHSVLAGGVIELNCQTFGDPKPIVEWILPDGSKLRAPYNNEDQRIVVAYNGRLIFKSVEISDTGVYHCIATNSLDVDVLAFRVTVLPLNTEEQEINGIRISHTLGQNLCLDCTSASSPEASIQWILPDHTILDKSYVRPLTYSHTKVSVFGNVLENGTLIIESVNEKDAGDFICVARNKVGDDVQLIRVSMSMKPARIKPNVFSRKKVTYGNDLKVDCVAAGVPMPEISWGLPDGTLVNSGLQADGSEGDQFKQYTLFNNGTLYLNKVGSDEEGDYTCYAENKLGKDKMHVHISVVTAVPRIQRPILSYAKVKPGRNVRFDCKAIGDPKPNVFWMLPSKDIIAASNDR